MDLTRRTLLGVGLAGLGGCVSTGSNVAYPRTETETRTGTGTPAESTAALVNDERTASDEQTPEGGSEPSVPNRALGSETARVYDQIEWFATEYDAAIDRYRRAVARAMATVQRVRDAAAFDAGALSTVADATDHAVSVADDELGGHFSIAEHMRDEVDTHLRTTRRFASRGDLDRVDEELDRLHDYLRGIRSDLFVNRVLSDRQIDARLYRDLHDGTLDPEDRDEDTDEQKDAPPGLFELYHSAGYRAYAYAGPRYIERDPFDNVDREMNEPVRGSELLATQRMLFDAPSEPSGRTGFAYVVSYAVPRADDQPTDLEPTDYPSTSLFVQRYSSVERATAAVGSLVDSSVAVEGWYSFGRDRWRRVYYRSGGDVVYAFLIQAGQHVLVAAPSEVAWEERVDWTAALDRMWLWHP
ncbi:MAG: hypothetical protein ABEJ82_09225 [Haloplanus sp.]